MTQQPLKSCPCCASTNLVPPPKTWPDGVVYCRDCGLRAISPEAWNRRPQPASDEALVDQLAYHIIEGSAGIRAAEHAKDFQTANWEDGLRSARAIIPIIHAREAAAKADAGTDWFKGEVDCDGEPLTTIPTHEYNRLTTDCEKFRDQVRDTCVRAERAEAQLAEAKADFQQGVDKWMDACFGETIKADKLERADRFCEEALELCQTAPGFTRDRAHALVDYVFGRPTGETFQEVGGVMVTLAALCNTFGISVAEAQEMELARVWTKVEQIRAKQASKPTGSALPVSYQSPKLAAAKADAERLAEACKHYDAALLIAFPHGAKGAVLDEWNAARIAVKGAVK